MTVESERGSSDRGVDAESTPTPKETPSNSTYDFYAGGNSDDESAAGVNRDVHADSVDVSPESLRTRADSLLDEMMLGAVDVSAADFSSRGAPASGAAAGGDTSRHDYDGYSSDRYGSDPYGADGHAANDFNSSGSGSRTADGTYDTGSAAQNGVSGEYAETSSWPSNGASRNGSYDAAGGASAPMGGTSQNGGDPSHAARSNDYASNDYASSAYSSSAYSEQANFAAPGVDTAQRQNGHAAEHSAEQVADEEGAPTPTPEWRVMSGGGTSDGDGSTWTEYVSSFRTPSASYSGSSGQIQKWQPDSPADGYPSSGSYSDKEGDGDELERGAPGTTARSSNYSGSAAGAESPSRHGDESESRNQDGGMGYVSAMSVMPKGPRRSSLLPRMSRFDVDALNREIAELHEEVRALLPVGHDQAERAQHLLDKAHTIAASDPERSAEVEYYMQQVRTIVERTRQSRRWSNLYRDRLRTYLLAWALLAVLTLTALLLSQFQMEAFLAGMFDAARDGVFMRNFAGALGAFMAGALGGAAGALMNMGKHARSQYGFFDRKYGLRGLILPLIGALAGLVIYSLFALVYQIAGVNPSLSAVAMATPALLSFVFGFSQESLYGTTG